ncbi:MAG: DUF4271 domain-containing protein [Flavobacteriaceae bacterium]
MIEWKNLFQQHDWELKTVFLLLFILLIILKNIDTDRFYALCNWRNRNPFPKRFHRESNIRSADPFSLINFVFLSIVITLYVHLYDELQFTRAWDWFDFMTTGIVVLTGFGVRWLLSRLLFFIFGASPSTYTTLANSNAALFRWGYGSFLLLCLASFNGFTVSSLQIIIIIYLMYLFWIQLGVVQQYFKLERRSYLSFILYLCALKISPWVMFTLWASSTKL